MLTNVDKMIASPGDQASTYWGSQVTKVLDVDLLIRELGGPARVAKIIGCSRQTPYTAAKRNSIGPAILAKILEHWADFGVSKSITDYFVEKR